jgi:hypothetical protein
MSYTVRYRRAAASALLGYLLRAADKPALMSVARDLDARLARDPSGEGESREPGQRWASFRPFSVLYRIDEPSRTVYVEAVSWAGY